MKEKTYVETYDWIRVIAIILVVIGHCSYLSIETAIGGVNYELPSTLNWHYDDVFCSTIREIGGWAYQFHMPLFFMLSGAVTAISNLESFDKMFEKKIIRLVVPYYVYGLLFMLPVKYYVGFYEQNTIKDATKSFLGISECGHLWFLPTLFWCFVFSYLLLKTVGRKSLYLLFLVVFFIWQCFPTISESYFGITLSVRYITWFVIGYIFEKKRQEKKEKFILGRAILQVVLLSIAVWAMSGALITPDDFITVLVKAYWMYSIADLCVNLVGQKSKIRNIVRILSKYSIYIYIFHDPLEYIVLKFAFQFDWLSSGYGVYLYFFLRTVVVFMVSFGMGIIIKTIKTLLYKKSQWEHIDG